MKLLWFIPTHGDGRYLGTSYGGRSLDYGYLKQIACAVDNLGFFGALLPTGRSCEDAWVTASALIPETRRMRFLVAVRPGLIAPSLAARMTATFDRLSQGRLLIAVAAKHIDHYLTWGEPPGGRGTEDRVGSERSRTLRANDSIWYSASRHRA